MSSSAAKLVDIGANLTNRRFQKDLPQVLRRAADAGVDAILITGTSMRGSQDALQLIHRMQPKSGSTTLFSTVGVHPHDAKDFDGVNSINKMRELILANPGTVVAVGECGLDFNRDFSPRDVQERVFRAQVELACELQMPLFLHEREAHTTFLSVLQPFIDAKRLPPVVVHCFTGNESDLRKYISMGFYIGLTGFVCMDSRGFKLRTMASLIPTNKLMIETDAPFMYPYGNNVKARCEPKDLRAVAQTLADCFRTTPDEIAAMTTANAKRFFSLDKRVTLRSTPLAAAAPAAAHSTNAPRSHKKKSAHDSALEQKPAASNQEQLGDDEPGVIVLNGGSGEGGGQLLRISVGLASVLQKSIRVHSIRANRKVPGLRNQHMHTIQLARSLSPSSTLIGAELNSTEIKFTGAGALSTGSTFEASSQTGGSVSLMIQGSLPSLVFSGGATTLQLSGGTHAGFSPPVDFIQVPLKQLLSRFGVETTLKIKKRGFNMGEIGEVEFSVTPVASRGPLKSIDVSHPSDKISKLYVRVTVFGSGSDLEVVGQQYVTALKRALTSSLGASLSKDTAQEFEILSEAAKAKSNRNRHRGRGSKGKLSSTAESTGAKPERPNVSIMVIAETATGGLLSVDRSGRDTPDYMALTVSKVLSQYIADGVCMDEHLADNAIVFMALAAGVSRLCVPSKAARTSQHLETALEVVEAIAGVQVRLEEGETSAVVEVLGIGFVAEP